MKPVNVMFAGFCVFHVFSEKPGTKYTAKVNATVVITYHFKCWMMLEIKIGGLILYFK